MDDCAHQPSRLPLIPWLPSNFDREKIYRPRHITSPFVRCGENLSGFLQKPCALRPHLAGQFFPRPKNLVPVADLAQVCNRSLQILDNVATVLLVG